MTQYVFTLFLVYEYCALRMEYRTYWLFLDFQGRAFNTFPMMGDTWIPEGILSLKPLVRNFFENTATVQVEFLSYIPNE